MLGTFDPPKPLLLLYIPRLLQRRATRLLPSPTVLVMSSELSTEHRLLPP